MNIRLIVNQHILKLALRGALVDQGANGGIAGSDTIVIYYTGRTVSLSGIDNHTVQDLDVVTAASVVQSHTSYVIIIMRQYCHMRDAKSIHSPLQLEQFECTVSDKAPGVNNGETPFVKTPDGYKIPIYYDDGLPYFRQRPVLDDNWKTLPVTYLTSEQQWNPRILNRQVPDTWYDTQKDTVQTYYQEQPFNRFGELKTVDDETQNQNGGKEEDPPCDPVSVADIRAHLCKLVHDEFSNPVLLYELGNEIYEADMTPEDYECDWLHINDHHWTCMEARSLRRSTRIRENTESQPS